MSFLSSSAKADLNSGKHHLQAASKDVANEFKSFLSDMEDLFQSSTSLTGDDLNKAKAQFKKRLAQAKESIGDTGDTVLEQARKTATVTNNYVHEQPWAAIGAGAAISFLVGFLLARRS